MPCLLEPDNYPSVHSLFQEMTHHLAVLTVLAGIVPGKVYVDDPANPQTAILIPANQQRVYVSGEPSSRLLADVIDRQFKASLAQSYGFVVYDVSAPWKQALEHALKKQETVPGSRAYYRLRELSSPSSQPLPETLSIARIDEAIVGDATLLNRQLLIDEIHSESPSLEHFFRHNFGFCAQDGHTLVGWCLAEYHYHDRYELGIETIETHRRQGIATHLTEAVIRYAFAQGAREIGWDCWTTNTPSIATALKLGFEKALDYPVFYCHYRPEPT
ncbi:GNAT family N-acetyltransferase [Ktedonosporobacter rubrisoli]|uniref:GNAT family N-acetyltransferase n=1 Tax=Ktedonosporobacter rubrisoli TaxID=2509675 RepID=A0A4V0YZ98_KTERU|nr:GNAT family N-acetyltransferase [Ktedonosporobacter rubrisoli]QBD78971.1 GNAT family N-acetyltransferase [Ktedonosporobacter rubrisoli]